MFVLPRQRCHFLEPDCRLSALWFWHNYCIAVHEAAAVARWLVHWTFAHQNWLWFPPVPIQDVDRISKGIRPKLACASEMPIANWFLVPQSGFLCWLWIQGNLEKSLNFRKLKKFLNCFGKRVEGLEKFGICLSWKFQHDLVTARTSCRSCCKAGRRTA